jgi:hypothetical protein
MAISGTELLRYVLVAPVLEGSKTAADLNPDIFTSAGAGVNQIIKILPASAPFTRRHLQQLVDD